MDNSFALLVIIKKGVNVGTLSKLFRGCTSFTYSSYLTYEKKKEGLPISTYPLSEFEFNFLSNYFSLLGGF